MQAAKTEYFTVKDDLVDTNYFGRISDYSVTSVQERTGQADRICHPHYGKFQ